MSVRLSAIILSHNEADNIRDCIASVAFADEVLVFDSGSTDGTQALAETAGARVVQAGPWQGFGKQRQAAQQAAQGDWILMIDADERVTPELQASIEAVIAQTPGKTAYAINRSSYFFGRFIKHCGWSPDWVARLYGKDQYQYDDAEVHEQLACPAAKVEQLDGLMLHYTCTDFQSFVTKSNRYAADWARARYRRGKRCGLHTALLHSLGCFIRKYLLQRGFLDGRHGLLLSLLASQYVFNKYAALWALNRQEQQDPQQKSQQSEHKEDKA